jgi:hypothetical protein
MAGKKQGEVSNRSNKIRFVLVEADISDGNLSELTQAITSALKPSVAPVRQIARTTTQALPPAPDEVQDTEHEEVEEVAAQEPQNGDESESVKTTPKKKFKLPDYLPELFAGEKGKAFKEFADEKAPSTKSKKYLVATYWLKEHGNSPTVNANKIYTAFKTAGWSTGFNDWNQTFHNLVFSEHLHKEGFGEFTITPLGEDVVTSGTD